MWNEKLNAKLIRGKIDAGDISEANGKSLIALNCPSKMAHAVVTYAEHNGCSIERAYRTVSSAASKPKPTPRQPSSAAPSYDNEARMRSWRATQQKVKASMGIGTRGFTGEEKE